MKPADRKSAILLLIKPSSINIYVTDRAEQKRAPNRRGKMG